jgi:hypothetical protein
MPIHYENTIGSFHSHKQSSFHLSSASLATSTELRQFPNADGTPDGPFSRKALETTRAHCERAGKTQEASNMAWLIQDYRSRTERLSASLDVDEGMKQDNRPADNLISIEGDV